MIRRNASRSRLREISDRTRWAVRNDRSITVLPTPGSFCSPVGYSYPVFRDQDTSAFSSVIAITTATETLEVLSTLLDHNIIMNGAVKQASDESCGDLYATNAVIDGGGRKDTPVLFVSASDRHSAGSTAVGSPSVVRVIDIGCPVDGPTVAPSTLQ